MSSILLVDGNPLVWRAAYGGQYEGIARTAITYFYEIVQKFSPLDIVVCWDKGKSRWRSDRFPEYKAHRVEKKKADELDLEKVQEQSNYVRRYLDSVGVRQILIPGVEADDVLSWLVEFCLLPHCQEKFASLGGLQVVVSTGDADLWQLVRPGVVVYDHSKGVVVDEQAVRSSFGVSPSLVPDLKAMAGDSSDNIPGVKGIGPVTGAALLEQYGNLGALLSLDEDALKDVKKKKAQARIYDDPDLVSEMYRLVRLPRLQEAAYLLNEEEWSALAVAAALPPKRNSFDHHMMQDRIGKTFSAGEALLPSRFADPLNPSSSLDLSDLADIVNEHWLWRLSMQEPSWNYLEDVDASVRSCSFCALRADCGEKGPTLPSGYKDAEIMIVGRNPGEQERDQGVPFYPGAPAGSRLDEFLKNVGLTRRECWITNVCKCYSAANRPPTQGEIMACLPHLRAELNFLRPKLVLAFGTEAMAALTPYSSRVTKHCGEILDKPSGGLVGEVNAKVAICVHPSAARRSTQSETEMKYAETQVKALLERVTR